jgi:malonyl CoA-acyl carrier protein transacylase
MKISKKCIKLDLSKDFVVTGSKSDLLKFEEVLKYNGVKDIDAWNKSMRISDHCNYLFFCSNKMHYQYHSHTCFCEPIDVKELL